MAIKTEEVADRIRKFVEKNGFKLVAGVLEEGGPLTVVVSGMRADGILIVIRELMAQWVESGKHSSSSQKDVSKVLEKMIEIINGILEKAENDLIKKHIVNQKIN